MDTVGNPNSIIFFFYIKMSFFKKQQQQMAFKIIFEFISYIFQLITMLNSLVNNFEKKFKWSYSKAVTS